jgi:hypothetical protein
VDIYTFSITRVEAAQAFAENMREGGRTAEVVEVTIPTSDAGNIRVLQVKVGKRPDEGQIAADFKRRKNEK